MASRRRHSEAVVVDTTYTFLYALNRPTLVDRDHVDLLAVPKLYRRALETRTTLRGNTSSVSRQLLYGGGRVIWCDIYKNSTLTYVEV